MQMARAGIEDLKAKLQKQERELAYLEREALKKIISKWADLIQEECRGNVLLRFLRGLTSQASEIERIMASPSANSSGEERTLDLPKIFDDLFHRFCLRLKPNYAIYAYRNTKSGETVSRPWSPGLEEPVSIPHIVEGNIEQLIDELDQHNLISKSLTSLKDSIIDSFGPSDIFTIGLEHQSSTPDFEHQSPAFQALFIFCGWIDNESERIILEVIPKFVLTTNQLLRTINQMRKTYIKVFRTGAHEVKGPLIVLRNMIEGGLGKGDFADPKGRDGYILRMKNIVQDCLTKVRTILDVRALLEFGQSYRQSVTVTERADVFEFIHQTVREVRAQFRSSPVVIEFNKKEAEAKLHWFTLRTDFDKLKDIIRNILTNACKYSWLETKPRVVVEVGRDNNGHLIIKVDDNGPGIPVEEEDQIFQPFFRGNYAEDHNIDGSGSGLFVSNNYAIRLGGVLTVKSKRHQKGVIARIEIPSISD
ncbi:MAG: HAMP domain-containing histidine kinase [Deltaproteobacteria bacterium]|nr:HAMP domain-containing histidine kinase [Deltaproteobacteria bacterium]